MLMPGRLNLAYGQDYNNETNNNYSYTINSASLQASAELPGPHDKIGISIILRPPNIQRPHNIQNSAKNDDFKISI